MTRNFLLNYQHHCHFSATYSSISTPFPHSSYFTKIPIPIPSFSNYHSSYLRQKQMERLVFSTLLLADSVHPYFSFLTLTHFCTASTKTFTIAPSNLMSSFCRQEVLCTPCPFKRSQELGGSSLTHFFHEVSFFCGKHALNHLQLQF